MKKFIIFLIMILSLSVYTKCKAQTPPESKWVLINGVVYRYYYIDGDEFGDPFHPGVLDNKKWSNSYPWGRSLCDEENGQNEIQYYTDGQNIDLSTYGKLKLTANNNQILARAIPYLDDDNIRCDGLPNLRTFNYTSGMIYMNREIKWGMFEINAKIPVGQGLFPAFWLYNDEEIDVFECKGECVYKSHWDVHYPNNPINPDPGGWVDTYGPLSGSFNTWRVDWGIGSVEWSFNSDIYALHFHQFPALNVIANLALGKNINSSSPCGTFGQGPPFNDGPNSTTPFPSSLEIDWIRIWKRLDCTSTINVCNYPQNLNDDESISGANVYFNSGCTSTISNILNKKIDIVAINEIVFDGETTIEGDCYSRIISCPGPPPEGRIGDNSNVYVDQFNEEGLPVSGISYERTTAGTEINGKGIQVYPNPTEGEFSIHAFAKTDTPSKLKILDINGRTVYENSNVIDEIVLIDFSKQNPGTYTIHYMNNNKIYSEKLIKY
jgi:beta-glucanase (GH16 family)